MHRSARRTAACSFAAALGAAVLAAPVAPTAAQAILFMEPELLRASEVLGRQVESPAHAKLGVIRDLFIDAATGKVEFLAVEAGAYPVQALRSGEGMELLLLTDDNASGGASAPAGLVRMSELMGRTLHDAAGRAAGRIVDVALNAYDGSVAYAVVSPGEGGTLLRMPLGGDVLRLPR